MVFVIVVICNLRDVFFIKPFKPYFIRGYIDFSSKNIKVGIFLLTLLFLKPFLDFFQAFSEMFILQEEFLGLHSLILNSCMIMP